MADADRLGKIASIGQDLITTQLTMATQTPSQALEGTWVSGIASESSMRSLNELTLMMVLKVSASSLLASSVSLRTLPIPRRRHSFAAPWTVRTIRAFKKVLPLEAPTFSFGLLTARKYPTRCSNISPDDRKKSACRTPAHLAFGGTLQMLSVRVWRV